MRNFLVQEYGKVTAKNSNFGIAAAVRSQMLRAQEKAASKSTSSLTASSAYGAANAVEPGQ